MQPEHTSVRRYRQMVVSLLLQRDGDKCGICGKRLDVSDVQIDHKVMCADGGTDHAINLQLAHPLCNAQKNGARAKNVCARGHDLTKPGSRIGKKRPRCGECSRLDAKGRYEKQGDKIRKQTAARMRKMNQRESANAA